MKLKPLGDRIVVKVLEREEKTKGGLRFRPCWLSARG